MSKSFILSFDLMGLTIERYPGIVAQLYDIEDGPSYIGKCRMSQE